jgi:hypothetical protein
LIDLWRYKLSVGASFRRMDRYQDTGTWIGLGSFGLEESCNEGPVGKDKYQATLLRMTGAYPL